MEACKDFKDVLSLLELDSYFPCKITLRNVFEAKQNDKIELKDIKWEILNKIINVDLRARDEVLSHILDIINERNGDEQKSERKQNDQEQKEPTNKMEILGINNSRYFIHKINCPLGTSSRRTLGGTVEATYSVPYEQKKTNSSDDVTLYLNLRGDAVQYPLLVDVIKSVSNVVVVLIQTMNMKNDDNVSKLLSSIYQTGSSVIIALESNLENDEERKLYDELQKMAKNSNNDFHCIDLKADGNFKGMSEIVKETKSGIVDCIVKTKCIPFSRFHQVLESFGIICDCAVKECIEGCQLANKMFEMTDVKSAYIQKMWIELSMFKKRKYREKSLHQKRNIQEQIQQIRSQQQNYLSNFSKMSIGMLKNLYELKDSPDTRMFFLKHLKLLLDKKTKKILPGLISMYNDLIRRSNDAGSDKDQLENQIKQLKNDIEDASFGVEHLMREVAQIFESLNCTTRKERYNANILEYVNKCPNIAADLLIEGYPLEMMDGAASDVPLVWVREVFRCLEIKIGSTAKLLTLSIMGIQSSGKSTLLNAMFGVQLAVSTGRCTRGIFLQLIPMPKDTFPFQYVLLFDTEKDCGQMKTENRVSHMNMITN
ncbi:unnamed protein product [Mytilus edulis]|uniref:VLIG-type G domain-containing protein n=1 Tax=Mytilus edulis TaxID=6550 RepID=A0A8S3RWG3_MYTED|nr:unnamed protein product [Mytilus edulis]